MGKDYFELGGRQFPAVTWYKDTGMRKTYIILCFVVLTSATNGYDGSMMNGLQTLPHWQSYFHNPKGSLLGLLNCIMSVGGLCAIPFVPYAADLLGRRVGIAIGCLIMAMGVVLQSISANLSMFIAARFFIGFGVSIAHGSSPLLITELVHPQHRAIFTTIYNTTWYLGSIVAAWLTYGTNYIDNNWQWRAPTIAQIFPSALQLIFVWFVPESPRWYISRGKIEKAHKVLANCHANGNLDDELVQLELQEIRDTIKLEQEFESNSWLELFKTKGNRHRLIILVSAGFFSQWSGNGLVSYYIHTILNEIGYTNSLTQNLINGVLQIFNFITAVTMCFFVDKIGRRKLFLMSTAGMLCAFIIWTICSARYSISENRAAAKAVVGMIYIYYFFYNLAWSGLLVGYTVEILPFNIRAKGMTVMFLCVDIALFFNQYVNPVALDNIGWKYYIFYCVWLGFELVVVWFFYIETRNTPLEEIAKHFDGDQAIVGGAGATEKSRQLAAEVGLGDTVRYGDEEEKTAHIVAHREVAAEKPTAPQSTQKQFHVFPPKSTTTRADKLALIQKWIRTSRTCHTLKDLEKILPQIASINSILVKDFIKDLTDDGKLKVEKIGTGNWYWSFEADALEEIRGKEKTKAGFERDLVKLEETVSVLQGKLEDGKRLKQRLEGDAAWMILAEKVRSLEQEVKDLRRQREGLECAADGGVNRMREEIERSKLQATISTDNVYILEAVLRDKLGVDKDTVQAIQKEFYGDDYVDGEGLRDVEGM
ncbi:putative hexose transporter protein [Phaeomoniella chlamydospora]|uniref:Putative hexose transporter protein n=1 Tax=Phaeomoniella chlamydospora TaxID=158046 RepID=A0A0G2E6P6_PHACM|nr:putative hexose transporter protein [Phaeomoniella chlamydospora]